MRLVNDPDVKLLLVALTIVVIGALWYFRDDIAPSAGEPEISQPEASVDDAPVTAGPLHPVEAWEPPEVDGGELVALPPLDDSDGYFVLALVDVFGRDIEQILADDALIDKIVATVDNLTRDHIAEKIRPVKDLTTAFNVDPTDDDDEYYLNPDNYERYDLAVNLAESANLEAVIATYRRFYSLFQESYVRLGYPNGHFNDRVVEVIDHLLDTPQPEQPIRLVRPHVLYEFADAELEALSSGQKLLLRMGAERATKIKRKLRALRARIA